VKYDFKVTGEIFEWRGPAPFYFVEISKKLSTEIKTEAAIHSYGWGVIHIHGVIGQTEFMTAMIPKDGCYRIPIKDAIRKCEDIEAGDKIIIKFNLGKKPN
jgi:hypothetical protein